MYAQQLEFGFMRKLHAHVDISHDKEAKDVRVGDIVTLHIKGKVKEVRGHSEYLIEPLGEGGKKGKGTTHKSPGSIEVEVHDMKVGSEEDFSDMDKD